MKRITLPGMACLLLVAGADAAAQTIAQQAYLKASNAAFLDHFGSAAALSGDTLVVTAWREDSAATGVNGNQADEGAPDSGAAYVFVRNGSTWTQQAYLKASNAGTGDEFGRSVALSGDTLVVGAWSEDSNATGVNGDGSNNAASGSGAAYVFVRHGTTWSQEAYLKASNTDVLDHFGQSVSISGDTLVVGAYSEKSHATGVNGDQADNSASGAGAAYVFLRSGGTWSQQAYLKASNTHATHAFGWAVAASADTVVVGAYGDSSGATGVNGDQGDTSAAFSGAAYVFVRSGTSWSQQAFLKASNTGASDEFGISVAASGDTVLVGAFGEASAALGVNGNQADNSAPGSGAAYVFVRSGGTWSQQAYLKASNTEATDNFAEHVALSGDTALIGADGEDSRATGVNGDGTDNNAPASGAAYLFVRSGAGWSQQAYLKASNAEGNDNGGTAVAVSGETAAVGALTEWSAATGVNGDQSDNSAFGAGAAYVFDLGPGHWTELGYGLAGSAGVPWLVGTGPLGAGTANALDLTHAQPFSAATLVVGVSLLAAPFKGGTLAPLPLRLLPLGTDAAGTLSLPFTWPSGVPAGTTLYFQDWISDPSGPAGFAASNGVKAVAQ